MVHLCTALSFLHCVIGYIYVLIENATIKSAKWNIVFYGRRCVCYILTLKIICTSRICISNHIMSNSKCDRVLGLLYAPLSLYLRPRALVCTQGSRMCPWGTFMPPRALVYTSPQACVPPPPNACAPKGFLMPLGAHLCPLGLINAP
jgi:hypothetical protein